MQPDRNRTNEPDVERQDPANNQLLKKSRHDDSLSRRNRKDRNDKICGIKKSSIYKGLIIGTIFLMACYMVFLSWQNHNMGQEIHNMGQEIERIRQNITLDAVRRVDETHDILNYQNLTGELIGTHDHMVINHFTTRTAEGLAIERHHVDTPGILEYANTHNISII